MDAIEALAQDVARQKRLKQIEQYTANAEYQHKLDQLQKSVNNPKSRSQAVGELQGKTVVQLPPEGSSVNRVFEQHWDKNKPS